MTSVSLPAVRTFMYSTTAKIKDEAGFQRNPNLPNSKVVGFQEAANSLIDANIALRYVLPLAAPVPALLELLERRLAAGYLMLDEYGVEGEGTSKDGNAKVKWAMEQLEMLSNGTIQLTDGSGVPITGINRIGMSGFPNNSTGTDRNINKDDPPIFEIGMKF